MIETFLGGAVGNSFFCKARAGYSWLLGRRGLVDLAFLKAGAAMRRFLRLARRLAASPFKKRCADTSGGNVSRETFSSSRNELKFLEASRLWLSGRR